MNNKATEYAIYLRKSRKDAELEAMGQGETLARHRAALMDLAEKQGLHIGRVYEEMVSGESIDARPAMLELLDDVYAGAWRGVLVMEVERLARGNTRDQGEVAEAFSMTGTLIVTPLKTYDPNDEYDEEYFEFGLFMSRREYKTIRRRMQRGVIDSVKEGNFIGAVTPYGYDAVRLNKKERILVPNDRAQYVKMIFSWFVDDRLTAGQIARRLTDMGVLTKKGKTEWDRGTIKDILQNIIYTGKVRWRRRKIVKEKVDGRVKKVKRRQDMDDSIIAEGKHQAIISEETFTAAQALFTGSAPVKASTDIINPLAGLLVCSDCGKAIRMQRFNKPGAVDRYVHSESAACRKKSALYTDVMTAVVEGLKVYIADFDMKQDNTRMLEEIKRAAEIRAQAEKEIASLEQRRVQLYEYLEDGTYTREEFSERRTAIKERIDKIQQTLDELAAAPEIDYTERIIRFSEVTDSLLNPDIGAKQKNQLLKDIISKITYDIEDLGWSKGGNLKLDIYLKE